MTIGRQVDRFEARLQRTPMVLARVGPTRALATGAAAVSRPAALAAALLVVLVGCAPRTGPTAAFSHLVKVRSPTETELRESGYPFVPEATPTADDVIPLSLLEPIVVDARIYELGRALGEPEEHELPDAFRTPSDTGPEGTPSSWGKDGDPAEVTASGTAIDAPGGALGDEPIDVAFAEAMLVHAVPPHVPWMERVRRRSGVVLVEALIGLSGQVEEARALRPIPGLDRAAVFAVRQWRFEPATRDGRPVRMRLTVALDFHRRRTG